VFWVISVQFDLRNTLPKLGPFLLGYLYRGIHVQGEGDTFEFFLNSYIVNELKEKNESNKKLHTMAVPIIVKQYEIYRRSLISKRNPF